MISISKLKLWVGGLFALTMLFSQHGHAQCLAGEVEVYIDIQTDTWGYEAYWELVPAGNACGTGTIFAGGNSSQVGCNGGGNQTATGGGYGNNLTATEGPWCFTIGNSYDIKYVDDYADGGASFTIWIDGYPIYNFTGTGAGNTFTFLASPPLQYDAAVEKITTFSYVQQGNVAIGGDIFNYGGDTITSLDIAYSINGGAMVSQPLSGLSIAPFTEYNFTHGTAWVPSNTGIYSLKIWTSNVNGNTDMDMSNDTLTKSVEVGDPIPNIIDAYLTSVPTPMVIGNVSDQLNNPRDLDFHPTLSRYELWVINTNTENSGGSTVTFSDAGKPSQNSVWKRDGNAWHFMSLPSAIAFGENENFATSTSVFDANHNGGAPFTGPALWSSDPNIYAQPSGGNGSHLDMLHVSPYSMGIAHEVDNVYWVFDGNSNDIVRYDFANDHGPGNGDHSDAIVRRYPELAVNRLNNQVASHLVLDKNTDWLYIADVGNARILRLDITSGTPGGVPSFNSLEGLAEYTNVTGTTWEVLISTGLVEPSGIEVFEDRLLVSDHSNGEIIIYDISGTGAMEIGRIQTGFAGLMGLKVGPEGKIWYVNANRNEVIRLDQMPVGISDGMENPYKVYPNPSNGNFNIEVPASISDLVSLMVWDLQGKEIAKYSLNEGLQRMDLSDLPGGTYMLGFFRNGILSGKEKITIH